MSRFWEAARRVTRRAGMFALVLASVAASAGVGYASEGTGDAVTDAAVEERRIRVIQQRPNLRALRLEVQALGGVGLGEAFVDQYLATGGLRLHIDEHWSIALLYAHHFGFESPLQAEVAEDFEVYPERSMVRWYAGAEVSFIPLEGKLAAFGEHVVWFDISLGIGGGVLQTSRSDAFMPAGMIGVSGRLWATRWLAVVLEVRDLVYYEEFNRGGQVMNEVLVQMGLSLFIPFGYDYEYPR